MRDNVKIEGACTQRPIRTGNLALSVLLPTRLRLDPGHRTRRVPMHGSQAAPEDMRKRYKMIERKKMSESASEMIEWWLRSLVSRNLRRVDQRLRLLRVEEEAAAFLFLVVVVEGPASAEAACCWGAGAREPEAMRLLLLTVCCTAALSVSPAVSFAVSPSVPASVPASSSSSSSSSPSSSPCSPSVCSTPPSCVSSVSEAWVLLPLFFLVMVTGGMAERRPNTLAAPAARFCSGDAGPLLPCCFFHSRSAFWKRAC
ncbi:hypothetical protein BDZ90DRAFT_110117 [Jaminaea rosea]|uniref:Uncharacterized protein n=1 Tax=Jaminaea rosea TaxID=1569628 RepID=A0A316UXG4_9BASI|nr:hypothetical protein BDZ90DRAFT_110117 [Jaminaea rosea]PWN29468.1 hypothetical protein BDZ90DRAFT_110117 [Jaminaea rosea]